MPVMLRSMVRLVCLLVNQPATSVTTILYYSERLPRNMNLERMVRNDLLDRDNHLLHFLISLLRCLW
ncbi:hypothetical protein BVC80_9069g44 [Macleaya cordata]|uniref:Secreted protein n=1 Tax=Macleaya cordata TaxID=56857 RepID=A0A200PP01_MACCD|nr:hypothetical protein BVC80_9069g44 [Macleaya cordata]